MRTVLLQPREGTNKIPVIGLSPRFRPLGECRSKNEDGRQFPAGMQGGLCRVKDPASIVRSLARIETAADVIVDVAAQLRFDLLLWKP